MNRKHDIVVGVSAGIAAYKTAGLVSQLTRAGIGVQVIMTPEAVNLVGPRTFEALTGNPVLVDMWAKSSGPIPHIRPGQLADLLCIAPATANILGKAANGIADDLLTSFLLAFQGPVLYCPAMNCHMWEKPAVQRNVRQLSEDGAILLGPESGHLACGEEGVGRMVEPEIIFAEIIHLLESLERER